MSKRITTIKRTGKNRDRDLSITQFLGSEKTGIMLQLTQGSANLLNDPDEPGFIQLSKNDVKVLIDFLESWVILEDKNENSIES